MFFIVLDLRLTIKARSGEPFFLSIYLICLSVFVADKPVVNEVIKQQGAQYQTKRCQQDRCRVALEQRIAETYTPGDTTLPPEHKRTLRRTTLTMTTQFDEKQQEP